MARNPAVLLALGVGLSAAILVWSVTRSSSAALRALATMCAEIFLTVIVAYLVARFVAMRGLHWLGMQLLW
ncbi:MAG: hypothetical protein M3Z20_18815 [Chloroflexota bacterium]|nr:hypothetical protein [Chloroflexota bacterium]